MLYDKGLKLIDIANQLGIPEGTVRSWKNRYNWDCNVAKEKRNVAKTKKNKKQNQEEPSVDEVSSIIENPELTDKQRLFCVHYIRSFNATKAYQKAYGCSYETAMVEGSSHLRNPKIKSEILKLKQERLNREFLSESDIFQKYMDIAFADITDYMTFGTEEVPVMAMYGPVKIKDPETGEEKQLTKIVNTVRFKDSSEVDGTILSEVKQGKDGASIKLSDRMKALQWLSDHMNMATEEQKAKIAQIKAQTDKLTGNNQEIEDLDDIEGEIYGSSQ
ncbi:phage portal protein [Ruminococcus sp. AM30-15AC]|nr:phage portal protein [Ruminococcus sp. AF13-37]RGW25044.1 phage portal protein [Ruminococcus sp. AF13-28]RHD97358.1 phage portal protein [Ruminococcus sp. AM30-15AC]DAU97154.1 MAG TPA: Terminase small subunit [Caudoviricetes sp.]